MNLLQKIYRGVVSKRVVKNNFRAITKNFSAVSDFNLISNLEFSKGIFIQIVSKILDGMSGVVWEFKGNELFILQERLKFMFEKDFIKIYKEFWNTGYAIIVVNHEKQDCAVLEPCDYGVLIENVVIKNEKYFDYKVYILKSDNYIMMNESDLCLSEPLYKQLEDILNAINATTKNLGALGMLTPDISGGFKGLELDEEEEKKLQDNWINKFGLGKSKWSMLFTNHALKFTPIVLPIKELGLQQKLEGTLKLIAGFHKVPYEMLPIAGQSTYTNREEARIGELINITCRSFANKQFSLAEEILLGYDVKPNFRLENAITAEQLSEEEQAKTENKNDLKSQK